MDKSTTLKKEKQTRYAWSPSDTQLLREQLQRYSGNVKNAAEDLHRRSLFVEHPLTSVKKKLRDIRQDDRYEQATKRTKLQESVDSWSLKQKDDDDEIDKDIVDTEIDNSDNEEEHETIQYTTGGEKFAKEQTLEPITILDATNIWFIWPQMSLPKRNTVLVGRNSVTLRYSIPPPDTELFKTLTSSVPEFPTQVPNPNSLRHFKFVHHYNCPPPYCT